MTDITSARAAYVDAQRRHAELIEASNEARCKVAHALADKQAALDKAAAGQSITAAHLKAADEAVREAEHEAALAEAVAGSGKAAVDRALITLREAEARAIEADAANAAKEQVSAAAEFSAALEAARAALARLQDAAARAANAHSRATSHNYQLSDDARDNAVMAAQHSSLWPKSRVASAGANVGGLRVELVRRNVEHLFAVTLDSVGLPTLPAKAAA